MKQIITTALLLVAGTALTNAASVVTTTVSFSAQNSPSTSVVNWKVNSTDGYYVGTSLSSLEMFSSFSWGAMTGATQIMNQYQNPLNLGTVVPYALSQPKVYGLTFSFTAAQDVSISSLGFLFVGAYNGGSFDNAANAKSENTSIELSCNGNEIASETSHVIYGTSKSEVENGLSGEKATANNVSLDFSPITLNAGETLSFTLNVEQADINTGLKNISIKASPVPEPSAFGLLAGLGALVLVAARRRRSRKVA